jgi:hypothetical protein
MMNIYSIGKKHSSKPFSLKKYRKGHRYVVARVFSRKVKDFDKHKNGNKSAKYEKEVVIDASKERQLNYKVRRDR